MSVTLAIPGCAARQRVGLFCVLALSTVLASQAFAQRASAASGPFAGMAGAWSGVGTVTMANGGRERIRCRASYDVGGDGSAMRQTLRCASDSYQFSLTGNLRAREGGDLTGDWTESTRNAGGSVSGRVRDGQIRGMIEGGPFAAQVSVHTSGDNQSVSLVSQGDVRTVAITMRRSR